MTGRMDIIEGQLMRLTDNMARHDEVLMKIMAVIERNENVTVMNTGAPAGPPTAPQPAVLAIQHAGHTTTAGQPTPPAEGVSAATIANAGLPGTTVAAPAAGSNRRRQRDDVQSPADSGSESDGRHAERFARRNSFNTTWTNKGNGPTGAKLMGVTRRPRKISRFVAFLNNRILSGREPLIPPLENRVHFLRTDPLFAGIFQSYVTFLGTGEQPPPPAPAEPERYPDEPHRQLILHNLAAMFFVTRDEQCPLDVMTMLVILEAGPERAWTMPTFTMRELDTVSVGALRQLHGRETWLGHMIPNGIDQASEGAKRFAAGLSLSSADQFRQCVRDQRIPGEVPLSAVHANPAMALPSVQHHPRDFQNHQPSIVTQARSRPGHGRDAFSVASFHRSVSQVSAPASPAVIPPVAVTAPRSNDVFRGKVTGPHYVGDRCLKCAQRGHKSTTCPNPAHEKFDPANPFALLEGVSHARPGYPSPS